MVLNRTLLSLVLLILFFESGNAKLDCPAPVDSSDFATNNTDDVGRFDQYLNAFNGSLIERIRADKTHEFYQHVVDNVVMLLCDVETASERCVEKDSPFASKKENGECIVAADSLCPLDLCERTSNCYWNAVKDMENRTMRFPPGDYAKAKDILYGMNRDSYVGGIVFNGALGVAISILLLLLWLVFFIVRYTCCCLWSPCSTLCFLCSPIPKTRYKTCLDKVVPILFYILALVGITAAASFAFLGNEEISIGITNTFLHADGLVDDITSFLLRSRIPLTNINGIIDYAALDAKLIFDGTEYVTADALTIVNSFIGFYALHSKGLNESNALSGFESALETFEDRVRPISIDVQTMLDTLENDLYDQADTIEGGITGAIDQLDSFTNQSSLWQEVIYEYEGQEFGFRPIRRAIALSIFLISFVLGILGLVAILLSRSPSCYAFFHMLKLTGFLSAILGSISLILASILLVISIFLFDSCKILSVVTEDLEPFLGEKVAPGANAIFNDTNLAVAFNVTDKVDFQRELDEQLSQIENINITSSFELVFEPLKDIQSMISSMTDPALAALNQVTSSNSTMCPYADVFDKTTIIAPWDLSRAATETPYIIRDNFGEATSYERNGLEDSTTYLSRVYNKAGICADSSECCLQLTITPPQLVRHPFPTIAIELYQREYKMTADLGVICPDTDCPSQEFATYSNLTLLAQLESYKSKISATKDSLVALASTSVGEAMLEVEDFLCNMNISFVEKRYQEMKNSVCGKSFLGIDKLIWSLFALGLSLEIIAIVSHVLIVRLRVSQKDKHLGDGSQDWSRGAQLY